MKNLILLGMLALSIVSFGRDYEYNEVRDIVAPINAELERISRLSDEQLYIEGSISAENIQKYNDFHTELERMERGSESR